MRRVNHPPCPHENPHVRYTTRAVPARGPEYQVPGLGLGARDMLTHGRAVLGVGGARDGFAEGGADGVLCESWKRGGSGVLEGEV